MITTKQEPRILVMQYGYARHAFYTVKIGKRNVRYTLCGLLCLPTDYLREGTVSCEVCLKRIRKLILDNKCLRINVYRNVMGVVFLKREARGAARVEAPVTRNFFNSLQLRKMKSVDR